MTIGRKSLTSAGAGSPMGQDVKAALDWLRRRSAAMILANTDQNAPQIFMALTYMGADFHEAEFGNGDLRGAVLRRSQPRGKDAEWCESLEGGFWCR